MRIASLYPRRTEAAQPANQEAAQAANTYGNQARNLLDQARGDAIAAISLALLANDQKALQASQPSVSEQALAQTVREQRERIDRLAGEVEHVDRITSVLAAVTATNSTHARMYADDLAALPVGTVIRDESDLAWTKVSYDGDGSWATPGRDDTADSLRLAEESATYLAWVADA